jgi:hypothetical protein
LRIGDGDHRIVETRLHMRHAGRDVLFFPAANARFLFDHDLVPHLTNSMERFNAPAAF